LILLILLYLTTPVTVSADQTELWQKLTIVANDDWKNIDVITNDDVNQLISLAKNGDANSQFVLGAMQQSKKNHYEAQQWLKLAADQEHLPALYKYSSNSVRQDMAVLDR